MHGVAGGRICRFELVVDGYSRHVAVCYGYVLYSNEMLWMEGVEDTCWETGKSVWVCLRLWFWF